MNVDGKSPILRRRVSVRKSAAAAKTKSKSANNPISSIQAASYIADMCGQLLLMAKDVQLGFLAHLLAMAQAEAESVAELRK